MSKQKSEEKQQKKLAKLEAKQKAQQEKGRKKKRREEAEDNFVCRGEHDSKAPVWRDSESWLWCDYCNEYGMCGRCSKKCKHKLISHMNSIGMVWKTQGFSSDED
jgi:ferredoxin